MECELARPHAAALAEVFTRPPRARSPSLTRGGVLDSIRRYTPASFRYSRSDRPTGVRMGTVRFKLVAAIALFLSVAGCRNTFDHAREQTSGVGGRGSSVSTARRLRQMNNPAMARTNSSCDNCRCSAANCPIDPVTGVRRPDSAQATPVTSVPRIEVERQAAEAIAGGTGDAVPVAGDGKSQWRPVGGTALPQASVTESHLPPPRIVTEREE